MGRSGRSNEKAVKAKTSRKEKKREQKASLDHSGEAHDATELDELDAELDQFDAELTGLIADTPDSDTRSELDSATLNTHTLIADTPDDDLTHDTPRRELIDSNEIDEALDQIDEALDEPNELDESHDPVDQTHEPHDPVDQTHEPHDPVDQTHEPHDPVNETHEPHDPVDQTHEPHDPVNELDKPHDPFGQTEEELTVANRQFTTFDEPAGFSAFNERGDLRRPRTVTPGELEPLHEAVRLILARPGGTPDGNLPKRIAAVAPLPGEGATTIARVFASVLSNDFGIETCYVDLSWGSTSKPGVFEVVMGTADLDDVLEWDGLTATIHSGDVSPAERHRLARSEILDKLIAELAGRFQYVILDFPAILSGSDGLAMMRLVDGYLLVVRHGQTTLRQVQITTSQLSNVTLLGTVLNHVRRRAPRSLRRWLTE